jgi:hypothetical protein
VVGARKKGFFLKMNWIPLGVLAGLLLTTGCGGSTSSSGMTTDDYEVLRSASVMFSQYMGANNGKTPPDEQAFRAFLETKKDALDQKGTTVDQLLTSPRNGESLVFVYGKTPVNGPMGMTYFAYEKTPVEGKRLVLASRGMFEQMDEAQFKKFFPNAQ